MLGALSLHQQALQGRVQAPRSDTGTAGPTDDLLKTARGMLRTPHSSAATEQLVGPRLPAVPACMRHGSECPIQSTKFHPSFKHLLRAVGGMVQAAQGGPAALQLLGSFRALG